MIPNSDDKNDFAMFFHFMDLARPSKGKQLHASLLILFPLSSETKATMTSAKEPPVRHDLLAQQRCVHAALPFRKAALSARPVGLTCPN